jgi:FAD/FMN-containing dehydrogenase
MIDQFGQGPIDVMKSIKNAMDPNGILNPAKIF